LQLLLIIDYIFDWARDLYRPLVLRLLDALSNPDFDDEASLAADSDIYSSWKHPLDDDMMSDVESDTSISDMRPVSRASKADEERLQP
jgi:hypothetical protein